jgi:hypothetical protein
VAAIGSQVRKILGRFGLAAVLGSDGLKVGAESGREGLSCQRGDLWGLPRCRASISSFAHLNEIWIIHASSLPVGQSSYAARRDTERERDLETLVVSVEVRHGVDPSSAALCNERGKSQCDTSLAGLEI